MIQRRTNRAPVAIGNMVPLLGAGYAAPGTRYCARCACRLSRYASQNETHCAPCQGVLHPWTMPEFRSKRYYDDCACGAKKSVTSMTCVTCYRERRRAKRRKEVDGRLKARPDGMCADCLIVPHRPRHSLCVKCSNARYRSVA